MGRFAVLAAVVLLGCSHLSAADNGIRDQNAAVGQNLTLSLDFSGLTSRHGLKWTHNTTVVYSRQGGKLSIGKADGILPTGDLFLKNLQFSDAGIYEATVSTADRIVATNTHRVCVLDAVTKPQLTYVCDFKTSNVAFNCSVTGPQALEFSWTLDKATLPRETRQTLTLPLGSLRGGSVMCAVTNKASRADSDALVPACGSPPPRPPPPPPPSAVVCLPYRTFGAVLAGAAGLVLVLLIIIIVLCCCHKRAKTQTTSGNKVELRLASLNKQELGPVSPDYETMHGTEDYRAWNKSASKFEGETENKSLQASAAAEEQKPSPVPKPRTKLTKTPN